MNDTLTIINIIMHLISIPLIIYLIYYHREHRKLVMQHMENIERHIDYLDNMNLKEK